MDQIITTDPDILGGTPVFAGTRVPVSCLFDALEHNRSIDYFLEQYPTVQRSQVVELLEEMKAQFFPEVAAS